MARGDGLARMGNRSSLRDQARPRRQLGCAARADVRVEPPARQAMDRRYGAGSACAELPIARAGGAARSRRSSSIAASGAIHRGRRAQRQGARPAVRADASRAASRERRRIGRPCRCPAFACSTSAGSSPARRRRAISRRWAPRSSRSRRLAAAIRAAHPNCTPFSARRSAASCSTSRRPEAVEIARALAARSDVLVENFATGVMDRLGLGAEALQSLNPDLLYVSASGLGRTGPEVARRRLRHAAAMLCRFRRAQPASRCSAARRVRLARPDVRPDAGVRRRRRRFGSGDMAVTWRGSISR